MSLFTTEQRKHTPRRSVVRLPLCCSASANAQAPSSPMSLFCPRKVSSLRSHGTCAAASKYSEDQDLETAVEHQCLCDRTSAVITKAIALHKCQCPSTQVKAPQYHVTYLQVQCLEAVVLLQCLSQCFGPEGSYAILLHHRSQIPSNPQKSLDEAYVNF